MFSELLVYNALRGFKKKKKKSCKFSEGESGTEFFVSKFEVQLEYCDVDASLNGYREFKNANGFCLQHF